MAKKAKSVLPLAPLPDLIEWLEATTTPGLIIGGLAVALLARPRLTHDLDLLVLLPEDQWPRFVEAARRYGFRPRIKNALALAHEARMLLMRHTKTGIEVDVSLGNLPFENEAVARGIKVDIAGVTAPLASPEDLVIMKGVAGREQDLLDIDSIIAVHPHLDVRRVRRWLRVFAEALDRPEILTAVAMRLARGRKPPRHRKRKK